MLERLKLIASTRPALRPTLLALMSNLRASGECVEAHYYGTLELLDLLMVGNGSVKYHSKYITTKI